MILLITSVCEGENMDVIEIINEIETGNYPIQEGLDYFMDCVVKVNISFIKHHDSVIPFLYI